MRGGCEGNAWMGTARRTHLGMHIPTFCHILVCTYVFIICLTVCTPRGFSVPFPTGSTSMHSPRNPRALTPVIRYLSWRCGKIPQDSVRSADHKQVMYALADHFREWPVPPIPPSDNPCLRKCRVNSPSRITLRNCHSKFPKPLSLKEMLFRIPQGAFP